MKSASVIYLDHAATTPMTDAAKMAWSEGVSLWANPSSPHAAGRRAREALEGARRTVAAALGWDGHVIFTSGASEAIALALVNPGGKRLLVSPVEHDAVLRLAPDADTIAVDETGRVQLDALDRQLSKSGQPALIAVQSVNSETGVVQPVDEIAAICRKYEAIWLSDCAQSAGKMPLPEAKMIAIGAHKLGGPPGIGALLVRDLGLLKPMGGQERGYRPGTENLPAALAFAAAVDEGSDWMHSACSLRDYLDGEIVAAGGEVVAGSAQRLSTIASYRMPGVDANAQLIRFDMAGIAVSAGSACSSGTLKQSHVLAAMGMDAGAARQVIRVSFGRTTTRAEVEDFLKVWRDIHAGARP